MRRYAWIVITVSLWTTACNTAPFGTVVGSGVRVTQEMPVGEFTSIEVGQAIQVDVSRDEECAVSLTADDNLFPHIKVTTEGGTLRIFQSARAVQLQQPIQAKVKMPNLEGVYLSGSSQATVREFKSPTDFKARLTGASVLKGTLEASRVEVDANGASKVSLKGAANGADLKATGASQLDLSDF